MFRCHKRVLPTLTALGVGAVLTAAAIAAGAQGAGNRGAAAAGQAQRPAMTLPSQAAGRTTLPPQASGVTLPSQAQSPPAPASQDGITTATGNIESEFARSVVSGELSGKDIAVDRANEQAKDIVAAAGENLDGREVAEAKRGEPLPEQAQEEEEPAE